MTTPLPGSSRAAILTVVASSPHLDLATNTAAGSERPWRRWARNEDCALDGFKLPTTVDRLSVLAAGLALIAVALIATGVTEMLWERRVQWAAPCCGLALMIVSLAVAGLAGWTQSYRSLADGQLVATVQATVVPGAPETMQVVFSPVVNDKVGYPQIFTIKGDEWQLSADIVTWQNWLNILGLHADYRFTSLSGYYEGGNEHNTKPTTSYTLGESHDTMSRFIQYHRDLAPLLRVTGGDEVRMLPGPFTYLVYLSTSGGWTAQS